MNKGIYAGNELLLFQPYSMLDDKVHIMIPGKSRQDLFDYGTMMSSIIEDIESNQNLVEKGKKIITWVSIGGVICSLIIAFFIQSMASVTLTVLFFLLLYKGYGWVRYYFIVTSVLSGIAIAIFVILYSSILFLIPSKYLIVLFILFVECIVLTAVLCTSKMRSRKPKEYFLIRQDKRYKNPPVIYNLYELYRRKDVCIQKSHKISD